MIGASRRRYPNTPLNPASLLTGGKNQEPTKMASSTRTIQAMNALQDEPIVRKSESGIKLKYFGQEVFLPYKYCTTNGFSKLAEKQKHNPESFQEHKITVDHHLRNNFSALINYLTRLLDADDACVSEIMKKENSGEILEDLLKLANLFGVNKIKQNLDNVLNNFIISLDGQKYKYPKNKIFSSQIKESKQGAKINLKSFGAINHLESNLKLEPNEIFLDSNISPKVTEYLKKYLEYSNKLENTTMSKEIQDKFQDELNEIFPSEPKDLLELLIICEQIDLGDTKAQVLELLQGNDLNNVELDLSAEDFLYLYQSLKDKDLNPVDLTPILNQAYKAILENFTSLKTALSEAMPELRDQFESITKISSQQLQRNMLNILLRDETQVRLTSENHKTSDFEHILAITNFIKNQSQDIQDASKEEQNLSSQTPIFHIVIEDIILGQGQAEEYQNLFTGFQNIELRNFSHIDSIEQLIDIIPVDAKILSIINSNLSVESSSQKLASKLETCNNLSKLSILDSQLGNQGLKSISAQLPDNIEILELSNNQIKSSGFAPLAESLKSKQNLQVLDISYNQSDYSILKKLFSNLQNTNISKLNLENVKFRGVLSKLKARISILAPIWPKLTYLNITRCSLGKKSFNWLKKNLKKSKKQKSWDWQSGGFIYEQNPLTKDLKDFYQKVIEARKKKLEKTTE